MAKWGKCDYKQLKEFQKKLEKLQQKDFDKFCQATARELAARLLTLVIKRTPVWEPNEDQKRGYIEIPAGKRVNFVTASGKQVDFVTKRAVKKPLRGVSPGGGTLRRGWIAKTEMEAKSKARKRPSTAEILAYVNGIRIARSGPQYIITIENPVHYAAYVEHGHRQLPGQYVPAIGKQLVGAWVAGLHMLTISKEQLEGIMPGMLNKKLYDFLRVNLGAE